MRSTTLALEAAAEAERATGGHDAAALHVAAGNRRWHVLMVAPTSFFADYGCHVRILEETRALRALGQRVSVAAYHSGRDVDGLAVRRTAPIPWRRDYEVGSSRHKLAFDALLGATTLRAALALRPDVIHGHLHEGALIGGLVARLVNRPLVFDFQGSLTGEMVDHGFLRRDGPWFRPARAIEDRIHRLPDLIVTSSHHAADHLRAAFGVPRRRLCTLPDGVNADVFRPDVLAPDAVAAARAALGIPPGRQVVVYLGLLARHQGTDLLIESARRVVDARPDTHFLVMGFPGADVYAARAAELGLAGHMTFTGRVLYHDAPARLALGDVAVAPKLSDTEGSGKLLNYMAMGLPTVTFDLPVSHEHLGGDGVYVAPGDAAAFADAVLALLADPAGARATGERLRRRAVDEHDWRRGGEALVRAYARVARGRTLRAAVA